MKPRKKHDERLVKDVVGIPAKQLAEFLRNDSFFKNEQISIHVEPLLEEGKKENIFASNWQVNVEVLFGGRYLSTTYFYSEKTKRKVIKKFIKTYKKMKVGWKPVLLA
jgi:hypothetical protein